MGAPVRLEPDQFRRVSPRHEQSRTSFQTEVITTAESTEFDVVVIGGGPGGYATALYGAAAGLSVAVVEKDKVGGTCLHRGCIPAKEFLETAVVVRTVAGAKEFGVQAGQPVVDFAVSQGRKQKVVDQLFKGLAGLMKGRGNVTFDGIGTLLPGHRVRVEPVAGHRRRRPATRRDHGPHVVLATGSVPRTIPASRSTAGWS